MDTIRKIKIKRDVSMIVAPIQLRRAARELLADQNPKFLSRTQKIGMLLIIASLFNFIFPHESHAFSFTPVKSSPSLIFELGNHISYMGQLQKIADEFMRKQNIQKELERQNKLSLKLQNYLKARRSPLADYSSVLVRQNNWKKIIALANAESTLCRRYPTDKANCWGVGGSKLWDMGQNLGEGVVRMNNFLNTHPLRSTVKYSQMSFERMNGLYKQPAANHWLYNNQVIYDELTELEKNL